MRAAAARSRLDFEASRGRLGLTATGEFYTCAQPIVLSWSWTCRGWLYEPAPRRHRPGGGSRAGADDDQHGSLASERV